MRDTAAGDANPQARGAERFAYHRQVSPLLWALLAIATVETGVIHLLVSHWSRAAALALSTLSALAIVFIAALLVSFRHRPIELNGRALRVRTGFLIDADVPIGEIAFVQSAFAPADYMPGSLLKASLLAYPNSVILLRRDVPLAGAFGRVRTVHAVAVAVDEPARFMAALTQQLKEAERAAA